MLLKSKPGNEALLICFNLANQSEACCPLLSVCLVLIPAFAQSLFTGLTGQSEVKGLAGQTQHKHFNKQIYFEVSEVTFG